MPYWHIRVLLKDKKSGSTTYSYTTDLSEVDAQTICKQYQQSTGMFWGGRWIDPMDVLEILVFQTEENSKIYETTESTGSVEIFSKRNGMDVSRQYIFSPPKAVSQKSENTNIAKIPSISKNVFIVHGRDLDAAYELSDIIKGLKLNPIMLTDQPAAGMTIIEKLEKYSDVGFTFILFTPDDIGGLAVKSKDLKSRARQNVVLEFGYFVALLGRDRVYCLYKGDIELPSDMHGVTYAQFNKSVGEVYPYIIRELKAVGYNLDC